MKIIVQVKNVYGNQVIYPICEKAKIFAAMVGQKTLTSSNIKHITQLGYTVEVEQPAIKL